MALRTLIAQWNEGPGEDAEVEPFLDGNGNRRIVVAVSHPDFPDGYAAYVPDSDIAAAQSALAIQSALGRPE